MILVFFILGFFIIICLIYLVLILSNLKIKIENLHIVLINGKIETNFPLVISIYFLNKIKIFKLKINKEKIKNKLNFNKIKENSRKSKEFIKILRELNYKIDYFKIEGYFGTFNLKLSSNIYFFIQSIIPILIATKLDGKYINNFKFLNINKNTISVRLNCIINIKIVNIINILQLNTKQRKGGIKENGRTSDRRINAYSNE